MAKISKATAAKKTAPVWASTSISTSTLSNVDSLKKRIEVILILRDRDVSLVIKKQLDRLLNERKEGWHVQAQALVEDLGSYADELMRNSKFDLSQQIIQMFKEYSTKVIETKHKMRDEEMNREYLSKNIEIWKIFLSQLSRGDIQQNPVTKSWTVKVEVMPIINSFKQHLEPLGYSYEQQMIKDVRNRILELKDLPEPEGPEMSYKGDYTKDFYAILGVDRHASQDDIAKTFRRLAAIWHPDKNKSPEAQAKIREINEAYDTLKDEQKRKLYNWLHFGS